MTFYPYPGHFLNDLYFEAGKLVDTQSPAFDTRYRLKASPWEGGSDASPLVWNYDTVGGVRVYKPIPALATFHFTDYTYHSSMDTMNKLSVRQLRDVGLMTAVFGFYRADADVKSAGEVLDIVQAASRQRFGWEKDNAAAHFLWALLHPYGAPATVDAALHEAFTGTGNTSTRSIGETQILGEWGTWYQQAVTSARELFAVADGSAAYDEHEAASLTAVTAHMDDAKANAAHLFAAFHFNASAVTINGGAEWTTTPNVTLALDAGSYAPGGVTGMRFSDDGASWSADFTSYATSSAYALPAGDGPKTVYVQFQDSEGNISDAVSASIKLDTTPPVITLTTPADGATYVKNQAVTADWSTWDAYSGVAGESGTVADGALIDTASFGAKSFTVTASDVAGNSATTTIGYSRGLLERRPALAAEPHDDKRRQRRQRVRQVPDLRRWWQVREHAHAAAAPGEADGGCRLGPRVRPRVHLGAEERHRVPLRRQDAAVHLQPQHEGTSGRHVPLAHRRRWRGRDLRSHPGQVDRRDGVTAKGGAARLPPWRAGWSHSPTQAARRGVGDGPTWSEAPDKARRRICPNLIWNTPGSAATLGSSRPRPRIARATSP